MVQKWISLRRTYRAKPRKSIRCLQYSSFCYLWEYGIYARNQAIARNKTQEIFIVIRRVKLSPLISSIWYIQTEDWSIFIKLVRSNNTLPSYVLWRRTATLNHQALFHRRICHVFRNWHGRSYIILSKEIKKRERRLGTSTTRNTEIIMQKY